MRRIHVRHFHVLHVHPVPQFADRLNVILCCVEAAIRELALTATRFESALVDRNH